MTTLAVTGGRVLRPDGSIDVADVLIDRSSGTISAVEPDLENTAERTLDASDGLVIPGFVNAHAHIAMTLLRGIADDEPLETWLRDYIWPIESELRPADVRAGAELGLLELIKSGTTTVVDMYFHMPEVVDAIDRSGLRGVLGHGVITAGKDDEAAHADAQAGIEFAEEYDGAADGRVSTAFMPHSLTTVDAATLETFVPKARDLGVPIHFHANETEHEVTPIVEEHGITPLEYAVDHGLLSATDFIAHGVHLDRSEIELLAETGAGVVHCPASNMKLASGMAPIQKLLDEGVPVALGTDGPASNNDLSLLDEMRDAAMIGKLAADDASALAAPDVLSMATAGGAAVTGIGTGTVEAGTPADVAVVDLRKPHLTPPHDLESHLTYAAAAGDIRHTVCDGEVLMEDRTVTTLDEVAVRKRAIERANALVGRSPVTR